MHAAPFRLSANHQKAELRAIRGDFEHLRADLSGEVRNVDPRQGVIREKANARAGRRLLKRPAKAQGRHRATVPPGVNQGFVKGHG